MRCNRWISPYLAVLLVTTLMVTGCRDTWAAPLVDAPVDPAGDIPIDTITKAILENVPELHADPHIRIAGDTNGALFTRISGLEYANGQTYITDELAHNVRVFSPDGSLVRTFGGRGGGPGELNYPRQIILSHDTLFVMDRTAIHRFKSDGTYITRATYQMTFHDPNGGDYGLAPQTFDATPEGLVSSVNFSVATMQSAGSRECARRRFPGCIQEREKGSQNCF
jgi:hypothetical protein